MSELARGVLSFLAVLPGVVLIAIGLRPFARPHERLRVARYRFAALDLALLPVVFAVFVAAFRLCHVQMSRIGGIQALTLAAGPMFVWGWGIRLLAAREVVDPRRRALFLVLVLPGLIIGAVALFALLVFNNFQLDSRLWAVGSLLFVAAEGLRRVNVWILRGRAPPQQERAPERPAPESNCHS